MGALFSSDKKTPSRIKFDFLTSPTHTTETTTDKETTDKETTTLGETKETTTPQDVEGLKLSNDMADYITRGKNMIQLLTDFPSTSEVQRHAMQNTKDDGAQNTAFDAVLPNALTIKTFFKYAEEMETKAPQILKFMINKGVTQCSAKQEQQWLENNQNVVHCLCDVLTFALMFDNVKQRSPDVQNDFAYYRRNMGKFHDKAQVGEAETNTIAMWLADGTPMVTRLTDAFCNVYEDSENGSDGIKHLLANIANVTCSMLMRGDIGKTSLTDPATENLHYCLCLMTAAIVLFDRVVPTGVFRKHSGCEIKKCILQLKTAMPLSQIYLNCIRFSSKHFQDKDTPASLANLIEEARTTVQ